MEINTSNSSYNLLFTKTKNMSLQIKSLSTILHNKCWQKMDVDKHQMLSGQIYDVLTKPHHWFIGLNLVSVPNIN